MAITSRRMRLLAKIGMKLDVLDDAELLLEARAGARARLSRRALRLRAGAAAAPQARRRRSRSSRSCSQIEPDNRAYRTTLRDGLRRARRATSEPFELYRELLAETPRAADLHLSIAHALKTLGGSRRPSSPTATAAAHPAELRRRLLEPRQSQDLSLHGR